MDFERSEAGVCGWFFVQTYEGAPWHGSPDQLVVTVTSPDEKHIVRPVVKSLPQTGMFGFDVHPDFLKQEGEYVAVIAAEDFSVPPLRRTFNVVHQDR
ncbi:MAG: hypothetical protein GTN93_10415 [Anaerolineae bacterium]|nr:hypothetical protein [Anaerolineae bacterium]